MAEFFYEAINSRGKRIKGNVIANDLETALSQLKSKGYYIIDIGEKNLFNKEISIKFLNKVSSKDLYLFCRQLATLLEAGLTLLTSLEVIRNQLSNKRLVKAVNNLYEDVKKGKTLSESMMENKDVFPDLLINMVEAGEVSGSLDNSFEKMAYHFEKDMKLKQKVTNALMYPAIVLLVAVIVLNLLLIFVIPTFVGLFNDLGVELPPTTKFILSTSSFIKNYWLMLLIMIILISILINIYKKTPSGSIFFSTLKLKIPIIGNISLNASIARFSRTLSTLIDAGVPLVAAIDTTKKLLGNAYIEKQFEDVAERVKGGEGLSRPIEDLEIFPTLVPVMIKTGEESGTLEEMLTKLADFYENEVENSVARLTAVFEPVMIVFLALIVGFMLASIILPMFKLYGNMNLG
ncbi:type II secretion system F family protein [Caloramator australicus]|uniref:Type IV fimbrial assembly protein PilC n=1 Tax=Caloramator australicus RC3 TaxID=857293 RepID=I7LG88_9CLOT|nr:type II secretion system F family protein [Caloramator australicus]CCJ33095.1 Type IV fimbrial assembly protein PilC [Caloramator australicus RC3]